MTAASSRLRVGVLVSGRGSNLQALLDAGAAHVIATEEQDFAKEVARITAGKGAQLVFDAVGGTRVDVQVAESVPLTMHVVRVRNASAIALCASAETPGSWAIISCG